MENIHFGVNNQNNRIGSQYNIVATTVNIANLTAARDASALVDFNFIEPTESFAGRGEEIQKLTELCFVENKKIVVICGCGGYGKTELARQFVHKCREDKRITHILWMEAESIDRLRQSFRDLATMLNIPIIDNDISLTQTIYQHFESRSCIIIFDNATNRKQILSFLPKGEYRCLVTSHLQDWGDDVPSVKLLPLSLEDSVNVLRAVLGQRFKDEDVRLYEELATNVSCVPLALQVTAAYTRQEMRSLDDDFNLHDHVLLVQKSYEDIMEHPVLDSNNYNLSVSKAIKVSFEKIKRINNKISNLACNVLHVCSYLYSDQILHSDLLEISCLKEFLTDPKDLIKVCSLLNDYSLISKIDKKITIHRLVQISIISQQNDLENLNHYYKSCLELLLQFNDNSKRHRDSILQYAENHLRTFSKFYLDHKLTIISHNSFLLNLVSTGCELYLKEIFDELDSEAACIINKYLLLHLVAGCKQHGVLELLLVRGADVHQRLNDGTTVLNIAVEQLDLHAVELLIKQKANVNVANADGDKVMHLIISKSNKSVFAGRSEEVREVLRLLAKYGARTAAVGQRGRTLLHAAALALNVDLIPFLISEFSQNINAEDNQKRTPIYYVSEAYIAGPSEERRLQTAACLLELGARFDHLDQFSMTPAEYACLQGYEYLAKYLEDPASLSEFKDIQVSEHADKLRTLVLTRQTSNLTQELDKFGEDAANKINQYFLLHEAAKCDMVELLLGRGADVNHRGDSNRTPLHLAAMKFNEPVMRMLVSHGADVNAIASRGQSVLFFLTQYLKLEGQHEACVVLRWLVGCGARTDVVADRGLTLLHAAASKQRTDIIACLIRDFHLDVNSPDEHGYTPVFYVIFAVHLQLADEVRGIRTAECLLELGAQGDVKVDDETPALFAYRLGYNKLGKYLEDVKLESLRKLAAAGDVVAVDGSEHVQAGQVPGHVDKLRALVLTGQASKLTQELDKLGEDAANKINQYFLLHEAAKCDMVELLLGRGADVNHRGDGNRTPLHLAAMHFNEPVMQMLVSHGADLNAMASGGESVLFCLIENLDLEGQHEACEVLRWLVGCGARTDVVTDCGNTLLHTAASRQRTDIITCLIRDFHLDVNAPDEHGYTPVFYVIFGVHLTDEVRGIRTAACLLELGARCDMKVHNTTPALLAYRLELDKLGKYLEDANVESLRELAAAGDVVAVDGSEHVQAGQVPGHVDKLRALVLTGQASKLTQELDKLGEDAANKINQYFLLHEAAKCDMVELLLGRGADVNHRGDGNRTPLHLAAMHFNEPVMQMLVSHGADLNAMASGGESVLFCLIENLDLEGQHEACEVLRWLVGCGARTDVVTDCGNTLLHTAASRQRTDIITCLIRDFHLDVNAPDEHGYTPVFYVIFGVHLTDEVRGIRTAACLLELGARCDMKVHNTTPALLAYRLELDKLGKYLEDANVESLRELAAAGDVVAVDGSEHVQAGQVSEHADKLRALVSTGQTSKLTQELDKLEEDAANNINQYCLLHIADECDMVELLLSRGADVNHRGDGNRTPLHLAAEHFNEPVMRMLVSHGADVNAMASDGRSVLYCLVRYLKLEGQHEACEVLRWLVGCGARADVVMDRGQTLLHVAAYRQRTDIIACLIRDFHLDVNALDADGVTSLFWVIIVVHLQLADEVRGIRTAACLLKHGAGCDMKIDDKTPTLFAYSLGLNKLGKYLEDAKLESLRELAAAGDVVAVDGSEHVQAWQVSQHADELRALVSTGQASDLTQILDNFGECAVDKISEYCLLHEAAECDMVELLLGRGAEIDHRGDGNRTPLHLAAMHFNEPVMRMLVSHGANVNAMATGGRSVLFCFIDCLELEGQHEACEVLRWLVGCGARADVVMDDGASLLHAAAYSQRTDIIACLIRDFHLDVNAPDKHGRTPVFYVILAVHAKVADEVRGIRTAACLLELGARRDVKFDDETPALYAYRKELNKLGKHLEDADVEPLRELAAAAMDGSEHVQAGQRVDPGAGARTGRGRWRWNSTYVGVGIAAAAAAALQIYRNS